MRIFRLGDPARGPSQRIQRGGGREGFLSDASPERPGHAPVAQGKMGTKGRHGPEPVRPPPSLGCPWTSISTTSARWTARKCWRRRPRIEQAVQAVFSREGFAVRRTPDEHAGGKWRLSYPSYTGQSGSLEVDLNFMFRQPLWEICHADSHPLRELSGQRSSPS